MPLRDIVHEGQVEAQMLGTTVLQPRTVPELERARRAELLRVGRLLWELLCALNKEEKVKAWLRTAQDDPNFDHWDGLARLLTPIFEDTNPYRDEAKTKIRTVLAKKRVTFLDGGILTTTPQIELAGVPASAPPTPTT